MFEFKSSAAGPERVCDGERTLSHPPTLARAETRALTPEAKCGRAEALSRAGPLSA